MVLAALSVLCMPLTVPSIGRGGLRPAGLCRRKVASMRPASVSLYLLSFSSALDPLGPGWCLLTMGHYGTIPLFKMSCNYQTQAACVRGEGEGG